MIPRAILILSLLVVASGCQPPVKQSSLVATKAFTDEELMKEYLRIQKEHVEALESKLDAKVLEEIKRRSEARLLEIQALPTERRQKLDEKYGRELSSLQERLGKAR
jgi:hypothetical protein